MNENCDSPFHRATESPTDRLVKGVKKRYCELLGDLLSNIQDIDILEMNYPFMSCCISVVIRFNKYQIRINYDMDKKQFTEPQIYLGNGNLAMEKGFLFGKEDIGVKIINIFAKFYEVSKLNGLGTKYGENFDSKETTNQMARKEYERLKEEHRKILIKEQEEHEKRIIRDAEFTKRITKNKN